MVTSIPALAMSIPAARSANSGSSSTSCIGSSYDEKAVTGVAVRRSCGQPENLVRGLEAPCHSPRKQLPAVRLLCGVQPAKEKPTSADGHASSSRPPASRRSRFPASHPPPAADGPRGSQRQPARTVTTSPATARQRTPASNGGQPGQFHVVTTSACGQRRLLCGNAITFAERLPHGPGHLVLDLAQLCPGKRVVRGGERPHVPHADGLQHVPGCGVRRHRLRDHPVLPDGGEGVLQQGAGCLAGQALPPVPADQAVTEVRDSGSSGWSGPCAGGSIMSPANSPSSSDADGAEPRVPPPEPNAIQKPRPSTLPVRAILCAWDSTTSAADRARPPR
jgi:hypothetical protein